MTRTEIKKSIISKGTILDFDQIALQLFNYQYAHNGIYRSYVDSLNVIPASVKSVSDIPYLPISAFKNYKIVSGDFVECKVYESSGTTGSVTSKHYVYDTHFYHQNALNLFEDEYGSLKDYCILALLPSYVERDNSSLVSMVEYFISKSEHVDSGFYLDDIDALQDLLTRNQTKGQKTLLIGVSFALLDLAIKVSSIDWSDIIFMETGGMKGRGKELPREELHRLMKKAFNVQSIHSEYGMTELLSQAYSLGDGVFKESRTMRVSISDLTDPFTEMHIGKSGLIRIVDLANIDSCAFIQTEDLGKKMSPSTFKILGRVDNSDIRGCNLLYI